MRPNITFSDEGDTFELRITGNVTEHADRTVAMVDIAHRLLEAKVERYRRPMTLSEIAAAIAANPPTPEERAAAARELNEQSEDTKEEAWRDPSEMVDPDDGMTVEAVMADTGTRRILSYDESIKFWVRPEDDHPLPDLFEVKEWIKWRPADA